MRQFERNKKSRRHILESKPVLAFLGICMLFFAWSVFGFWDKMKETQRYRELAEEKVNMLKERKEARERDIAALETDRGKEEFFRENLGLSKAGEDVIVIVEDRAAASEPRRSGLTGIFSFFRNLFR